MQPGRRGVACAQQLGGERRGRRIAPLDQQPLRGVAPPLVRVGEGGDQRLEIGRGQVRTHRWQPLARHDPVDGSLVVSGAHVEGRFDRVGNPLGMLDHRAVHVDDIQRAFGSGGQRDGTEPVIAAGEQLDAFGAAGGGEARGVCGQHVLMHDVHHDVVHEETGVVGCPQRAPTVKRDARAARETAGLFRMT